MPTTSLTAALKDRLKELDSERKSIQRFLGSLIKKAGGVIKTAPRASRKARKGTVKKRRKMSAAVKRKMSRLAKARWAAAKKAGRKGL